MKRVVSLFNPGMATLSCFYWWGSVWSAAMKAKKMILYNSCIYIYYAI